MRRGALPRLTDRLALGRSGLRVSPVCLGITAAEVPAAAFDAGINFFFLSADMHWPYYRGLRHGLARLCARAREARDQIVVGVVSYVTQPEFCRAPLAEVVQAVPGLTRVDLAVMGGVYPADLATRLPIYRRHRDERFLGIRALGASFHDHGPALAALNDGALDVAFVRYNAAHAGACDDLFAGRSAASPSLLFTFKSTQGHRGARPVADQYRFVLGRPAIDGILVALRSPRELRDLDEALARGPLSDDEERELTG